MIDFTETKLNFKKINILGSDVEGKNSTVWIAKDLQLDSEIIVKGIKKTELDSQNFFKESKILYLSRHPNIVPINYACQDNIYIYLSMPYYSKGTINSLMNTRYLTVKEIIKYGIDLLSSIYHLHSLNLVHLDIKPTNLLISNSNDVLLADFGLSQILNDTGFTEIDKFYFSHGAPEIIRNRVATTFTDLYQCGITLYRMCNGNDFFKTQLTNYTDINVLKQDILNGLFPKREYLPHIPIKLQKIINKAIEPSTSNRYINALDFLNDLSNIDVDFDWQFTKNTGVKQWEFITNENKKYTILLTDLENNKYNLTSTSYILGSTIKSIKQYCKTDLNKKQAAQLLNIGFKNNFG